MKDNEEDGKLKTNSTQEINQNTIIQKYMAKYVLKYK